MKIIKYTFPLILAFLGFLIYSNILNAPFFFDDEIYIVDNYQVHNISSFFKDFSGTRYVGFLTFAINYYFGGLNTVGYHLVNIIIHIVNAILVYVLIQITLQRVQGFEGSRVQENTRPLDSLTPRLLPFSVSLIFLVHPIQTQAVSYITQRFTSLATLFYLLALVLYVKARVLGFGGSRVQENTRPPDPLTPGTLYVLSILSTILAMKTKEISFTLPFIIILYEFTFLNPPSILAGAGFKPAPTESPLPLRERHHIFPLSLWERVRVRGIYLLPFFLTLLIIPLTLVAGKGMDELAQGQEISGKLKEAQLADISSLSAYNYLLTQFRVIVTYIRLLFFPVNQTFEYDYPIFKTFFDIQVVLSFLFLLSVLGFAIYLYLRSRKTGNGHGILISFGIFWFFITLSIESSIIPIRDVIFEHRMYLPSIGFILALVIAIFLGFKSLEERLNKSLFTYFLTIIGILVFSFSSAAYTRNMMWQDELAILEDEVIKSPNKATVHNNLGIAYAARGWLNKAIKEYLTALELTQDYRYNKEVYVYAHNNLGIAYKNKGLLDMAIREYKKAIEIWKTFPEAHNNLGSAYAVKGLIDDAINEYKIALSLNKYLYTAHNNLGSAYKDKDLIDEAIDEFKTAIKLDPYFPEAHYNLGAAYEEKGLMEMAKNEYETAIKLEPRLAEAYLRLEETLLKAGFIAKANEAFQAAGRLGKNIHSPD
ncbi:MAG: tetratricopeptide repeat protein [Deltaproteobacteria bacterium]|nr:tetratricopeptide repeat protein [Deltaproteobacteria bacterium]